MCKKLEVPKSINDFTADWVQSVTQNYFSNLFGSEDISMKLIKTEKNCTQGLLSTTYKLSVKCDYEDTTELKNLFIKVPKQGPDYSSYNFKELMMLTKVLPTIKKFLDQECDYLSVPIAESIYCYFDGQGIHDVFIFEDLTSEGFENLNSSEDLNEEHFHSCLDALSQLHGSGLAFKNHLKSKGQTLQDVFPELQEQVEVKDLLQNDNKFNYLHKNFIPFMHYLEQTEPDLQPFTRFMKKIGKYIIGIVHNLEESGYDKFKTLCHGDSKPNNFLFRKQIIDIEDLECEGLEAILIDWQGSFIGSIANDLMWAMYPFVSSNMEYKNKAFDYYFESLKSVLESFRLNLDTFDLTEDPIELKSILIKALSLEFLLMTAIKPIMSLDEESSQSLILWYKDIINPPSGYFSKPPTSKPKSLRIYGSERFPEFCSLYFRIASTLGGVTELAKINFELMKDDLLETKDPDFDNNKKLDINFSVIYIFCFFIGVITAILLFYYFNYL